MGEPITDISDALIQDYELRAKDLDDDDYKKIEVDPIDVKDIQNTPQGVHGFWLRAMLFNPQIAKLITEKDRQVLQHLQEVRCTLHDKEPAGYGFDLVFQFEKNDYFNNEEPLKKSFVMAKQHIIEKCEGTEISWKEGRDPTKKKTKKKNKKTKKTETKTVDAESFFSFFKSAALPDSKDLANIKEEEEKELGDKMDDDFELGNEFKDQLIPLALEYYLEVIEHEEGEPPGDYGDEDDQPHD